MSNPLFSTVRLKRPKSNVFDLSHERKLSFNMGSLIPILLEEVVPGDRFRLNTELFIRLAPMLAPMMHRVNVYTHFFFVPNRLVFDGWQDFITGGLDGTDFTVFPQMNVLDASSKAVFGVGTLSDYFGLPDMSGADDDIYLNALPFRAYQLIYNEYYRDQTLSSPVVINTGSSVSVSQISVLTQLRQRAWEKDYFTSALPWSQRGADVMLPLGTEAPIVFNDSPNPALWRGINGGSLPDSHVAIQSWSGESVASNGQDALYDPSGSLTADLTQATSSTVNEYRRAIRLQEWLEKNARAGSRYIEQILSHFGVRSSDSRLQRPEFLGGGKSPVVISEVLQTSSTDSTTPQGNMSGHGIAVGNTHGFKRFFEEHGFVMGIMSVLPRTSYSQGIPRKFSKPDKFDYFWPSFAHLGEQAILNKELYCDTSSGNDDVFGYTPRYAEYKFAPNTFHGDFKTNMDYWHMGRLFSSRPHLNDSFIKSDPTHRVFAVTDPTVHKLYCQVFHNLKAIRPMPKFGTPTI
jgi:hypothetical protein